MSLRARWHLWRYRRLSSAAERLFRHAEALFRSAAAHRDAAGLTGARGPPIAKRGEEARGRGR